MLGSLPTFLTLLLLFGMQGEVSGLAEKGPGGSLLSCGLDCTLRLWDLRAAAQAVSFTSTLGGMTSVVALPDEVRWLLGQQ